MENVHEKEHKREIFYEKEHKKETIHDKSAISTFNDKSFDNNRLNGK